MMDDQIQVGDYSYSDTGTNCIGSGAQGSVYRCFKRNINEPLCIKVIKLVNDNDEMRNLQRKELQVGLGLLNHQNQHLVKLYDFYEMNNKIYIIMEECETNLEKIKQFFKQFPQYAICVIQQIVDGYKTLYEKKVIHRDIKPTNILFSKNGFKICDLGVAKILGTATSTNSAKGTARFMSPQVANNFFQISTKVDYTNKTDIFSLGMTFYYLAFSDFPYRVDTNSRLQISMLRFSQNPITFDEAKLGPGISELLKKMLQYREEDRISWEELFQHPLITQAREWSPLLNEQIYRQLQITPQAGIQQDPQYNDQTNNDIPNSQISQYTLQPQNQHQSNQQYQDRSQYTIPRQPTNDQDPFIGPTQTTRLIGQVQQVNSSDQSTEYQNQQFQQ